jgi:threonine dehydrogenase-like Zn-dependent dehydrogenase
MNKHRTLLYNGPVKLPVILGHEFSGEVIAVGQGVQSFRGGELIVGESLIGCGYCRYCRGGAPNQCVELQMLGINRDGAFAEYITIPERHAWNICSLLEAFPSQIEAAEAASLIEPLGCAYNALFINGGGVLPGENAVVYGCGPIGLGAISLLRLAGAGYIVAVEPEPARRNYALECGADLVISPENLDNILPETLHEITRENTANIQIDCSGAMDKIVNAVEKCMAPRGRFISVGRSDSKPLIDINHLVTQAGQIIGSRGHVGGNVFPNLINMFASKRINPRKIITHRYRFNDIIKAFAEVGLNNTGKVIIQMEINK